MNNHQSNQTLIIEAGRAESQYWRDLWRFRELLGFLAWRDILVRYKQTVFGVAWAWLRPLLTMITFTFVFGKLAKLPSGDLPYSVLAFAGILPWQFFSGAFNAAASSMIDNGNLISKIYFPRLVLPISAILVCLVDTVIAAILLAVLMLWFGVWPNWHIIFLPFFLLLAILLSMGTGLLVAALNVRYRDFRYIIPFAMQFGLYISPVGFSSAIVPEKYRSLYDFNPVVGVIDGFRWSLLGDQQHLDPLAVLLSAATTLLFLVWGIYYFRRTEQTFADII